MNNIYLDHTSGTPVHKEVLEAMLPYLRDNFGNPQSMHTFGEKVKSAIEDAREKVAKLINCLLYTSPSPRDRQKSRMPSSA